MLARHSDVASQTASNIWRRMSAGNARRPPVRCSGIGRVGLSPNESQHEAQPLRDMSGTYGITCVIGSSIGSTSAHKHCLKSDSFPTASRCERLGMLCASVRN